MNKIKFKYEIGDYWENILVMEWFTKFIML